MAEKPEVQDKFRSIFSAYLRLESQSYEFIVRSIAMHNWLKQAYRLLQEKPTLSAEEMYAAWYPSFNQIYGNLFAAFLRPYRAMLHPFGQALEMQLENNPPGNLASGGLAAFKLWGEAQSRFLNGIAGALHSYSQESDGVVKAAELGDIERLQELTPTGLLRKIADEETIAYFETLDQFLGYIGQNQFLLPKTMIIHLQKVISSYPRAYRLAHEYQTMFHDTWEKSLKKFTGEVREIPGRKIEFEQFFKTYISVFTSEFDSLMRSPKFIEVQTNFLTITSETTFSMRQVMEAQLGMFPASPFVTGGEIDSLEERVHGYKQRIDGLERKVREMETRLNLMGQGAEPNVQPVISSDSITQQNLMEKK